MVLNPLLYIALHHLYFPKGNIRHSIAVLTIESCQINGKLLFPTVCDSFFIIVYCLEPIHHFVSPISHGLRVVGKFSKRSAQYGVV